MSILHRMLLRTFVPIFLVATLFFVLLFQLIDVFSSIWRYFAHDVTLLEIGRIALLYLPKCLSFSLPVAFLFAIANTLGNFYAGNELFAIFGSGVSLYRLVTPFLALGLLLSVAGFFFEDAGRHPELPAEERGVRARRQAGDDAEPVQCHGDQPRPARGLPGRLLQRRAEAAVGAHGDRARRRT